jgi:predicted GNAT family acetyltransferase
MSNDIRHEPERNRFVLEMDGLASVLEYRQADPATLDYYRTFVPPALRGRGIASSITGAALRYARDAGLKVIPTCPFVASYIERHPELKDIVAG